MKRAKRENENAPKRAGKRRWVPLLLLLLVLLLIFYKGEKQKESALVGPGEEHSGSRGSATGPAPQPAEEKTGEPIPAAGRLPEREPPPLDKTGAIAAAPPRQEAREETQPMDPGARTAPPSEPPALTGKIEAQRDNEPPVPAESSGAALAQPVQPSRPVAKPAQGSKPADGKVEVSPSPAVTSERVVEAPPEIEPPAVAESRGAALAKGPDSPAPARPVQPLPEVQAAQGSKPTETPSPRTLTPEGIAAVQPEIELSTIAEASGAAVPAETAQPPLQEPVAVGEAGPLAGEVPALPAPAAELSSDSSPAAVGAQHEAIEAPSPGKEAQPPAVYTPMLEDNKDPMGPVILPSIDPLVVRAFAKVVGKNLLLQWIPGEPDTSYKIYWGAQPDPVATGSVAEGIRDSAFVIPDLKMGQTYYVAVEGIRDGAVVSKTPKPMAVTIPLRPPDIASTDIHVSEVNQELLIEEGSSGATVLLRGTENNVLISWTAEEGITYNLYWGTKLPLSKMNARKIPGVTPPYLHKAPSQGMIYYFLTINDGRGESAESRIFSSHIPSSP